MVLGFIDVRNEGGGDQEVIDGDDAFAVTDEFAVDFSTRRVVVGRSQAGHRELSRLAVRDHADKMSLTEGGLAVEGGKDFTGKDLQEQSLGITSAVNLTEA